MQKIILTLLILISAQKGIAESQIYIDVGTAKVKKSLIALPSFQYFGSSKGLDNIKIGQELFATVRNDLEVSTFFSFINPDAFLEDPAKVGLKPAPGEPNGFNFKNWTTIGAEFLIRAGYSVVGDKISLQTYLYYVPKGQLVIGKSYEGPKIAARKMAHTFVDEVLLNLTGKRGSFNTKFVFTSDRGGNKTKEIFVMDWDGYNLVPISNHKSIAISPNWSPNGKTIAYTAFEYHPKNKTRNADLFTYELTTGKRTLLSYRKGMNSGAAFTPDGRNILLTLSLKGSPDIYKMSLDGESIMPLTHGPLGALNVEPAVDSSGSQVAFSSDRSGSPMIYTMRSDGTQVQRRTIAGKYNASPSWSPDGKKIAFSGMDNGRFDVFVMDSDGMNMQRLTSAVRVDGKPANNEDPSFSPDGRSVVFVSDRSGTKQLYTISVDGTNERRITTDKYNYERPKWSPYLD